MNKKLLIEVLIAITILALTMIFYNSTLTGITLFLAIIILLLLIIMSIARLARIRKLMKVEDKLEKSR